MSTSKQPQEKPVGGRSFFPLEESGSMSMHPRNKDGYAFANIAGTCKEACLRSELFRSFACCVRLSTVTNNSMAHTGTGEGRETKKESMNCSIPGGKHTAVGVAFRRRSHITNSHPTMEVYHDDSRNQSQGRQGRGSVLL